MSEVNKRLNAPVHVSDINFSLLARFPSASLVMDSVWAEESIVKIGKADTLLVFRKGLSQPQYSRHSQRSIQDQRD